MEDKCNNHLADENVQELSTSRRRLLKKIALTTGTLGASFLLPVKWSQPLIDTVFLPAHAQTSAGSIPPVIEEFTLSLYDRFSTGGPAPKAASPKLWGASHTGDFDYSDNPCQVDGNTILDYIVTDGGELEFRSGWGTGQTLAAIGASIGGNGCSGNIAFNFLTNAFGKTLAISLTVNGRQSNWINSSNSIPAIPNPA
ncbi:MAG: hypothetical protein V1793_03510 [Pseudomonadota bacterium]